MLPASINRGVPPVDAITASGLTMSAANTIWPSTFHVPPRGRRTSVTLCTRILTTADGLANNVVDRIVRDSHG